MTIDEKPHSLFLLLKKIKLYLFQPLWKVMVYMVAKRLLNLHMFE